ncbi:MAG: hypothetical protein WCJ36_01590 [Candidatus Saccharibacteria bacterium]
MNLPNGTNIIARIDGGSRNHINLSSMFGNDCKQVMVEFLVVEKDTKQGIVRIDSEPEPLEEVVSIFSNSKYYIDRAQNQFIPVLLPNKKMGLFDCRAAKNVLKNYDEIEIIRSIQQGDRLFRKEYYERRPFLFRAVLCRVKRNNKFGLIVIVSADSNSYGFNNAIFGTKTKVQVKMGIIYDSILFDEENCRVIAIKDGKTIFKTFG